MKYFPWRVLFFFWCFLMARIAVWLLYGLWMLRL
jgi:hypothetical protein